MPSSSLVSIYLLSALFFYSLLYSLLYYPISIHHCSLKSSCHISSNNPSCWLIWQFWVFSANSICFDCVMNSGYQKMALLSILGPGLEVIWTSIIICSWSILGLLLFFWDIPTTPVHIHLLLLQYHMLLQPFLTFPAPQHNLSTPGTELMLIWNSLPFNNLLSNNLLLNSLLLNSLLFNLVMCQLWPEARGWAKLGLIFGLRWLLAWPGFWASQSWWLGLQSERLAAK